LTEFEKALLDVLESARKEGKMVAYQLNEQLDDMFLCGFFLRMEEANLCIFEDVGRFGFPENDGPTEEEAIEISDIAWVETDTPFLHGLSAIYEYRDRFLCPLETPILHEPTRIWQGVAEAARERNLVKFWLRSDEEQFAYVRRFESPLVELELVHEDDGSVAGTRLMTLTEINSMRMGSRTEEMIQFLYDSRYSIPEP